jgi:hypothetical protein
MPKARRAYPVVRPDASVMTPMERGNEPNGTGGSSSISLCSDAGASLESTKRSELKPQEFMPEPQEKASTGRNLHPVSVRRVCKPGEVLDVEENAFRSALETPPFR